MDESKPTTSAEAATAEAATAEAATADVSTAESAPADAEESAESALLKAHAMMVQLTTDGIPKLHCPVCNKALVSLNGYVKHLKKHEPPGGFFCRYCDSRFCSEDEVKRHTDEVHMTIACRICVDKTFNSEIDYRAHIRDFHDGIDRVMFKCDKCGAEYKTIDPFRRHIKTECGTLKPHKCDECSQTFVTKYNLKQHKETHKGERKFCCSFCGKNFLQKGRLVEHERSHTGEKPYKCDVCGKCFAHRESIVTHSSIHTGIRLVECKCCNWRFSCYSNLIKHRRSRPGTCGRPEYDPPKNRTRTHRSRIPPSLNPTSEIKVSNSNKVIKAVDQNRAVKRQKSVAATEPKEPKANSTKGQKRGGRKKKPKSDTETDTAHEASDEEFISEPDTESDSKNLKEKSLLKKMTGKRSTRGSITKKNSLSPKTKKSRYVTTDSEDDLPDFDPIDDSDTASEVELPLPVPKITIKQEKTDLDNHFEYTDPSTFMDMDFAVKSEEGGGVGSSGSNIFNEKDKLLYSIFNNDGQQEQQAYAPDVLALSPHPNIRNIKIENDDSLLEETEVILVKGEQDVLPDEEDVLDANDFNASDVLSVDMTITTKKQRGTRNSGTRGRRKRGGGTSGTRTQPRRKHEKKNASKNNTEADDDSVKGATKENTDVDADGDGDEDEAPEDEDYKPRRTYRKRAGAKNWRTTAPSKPNRVAKFSQQELKARLKMLRREVKCWSCPHCIKIYYMRKPFEKHLRDDHKRPEEEIREMFKCEEVGVINEDIFKCKICDKIYLVEKRLLAHIKLHGPDGKLIFKCPCYCNLYFGTKDEATAHAQQAHRELLYCELCKKFMTGHDSLKNHMKKHHHNENEKEPRKTDRNFVCDKCGRKYSGRTSLTDHVRSDCGRKPLYPCPVCGKHLTTAGILKTHMLLHKDDTPFQCEECGKTFKVKAQYKTHIRTRHTDYKPFKCHLCPKAYPYRESLLTHMTVHTGIKRFLCNGCGKRFTCISNLQAHRKVHAETCGQLPLNAKATQYMGVQKGNLLLGAKPEAGVDYVETNTLIAKEVLSHDLPMAQELNYPSEPSAPLATVPLNFAAGQGHLFLPSMMLP